MRFLQSLALLALGCCLAACPSSAASEEYAVDSSLSWLRGDTGWAVDALLDPAPDPKIGDSDEGMGKIGHIDEGTMRVSVSETSGAQPGTPGITFEEIVVGNAPDLLWMEFSLSPEIALLAFTFERRVIRLDPEQGPITADLRQIDDYRYGFGPLILPLVVDVPYGGSELSLPVPQIHLDVVAEGVIDRWSGESDEHVVLIDLTLEPTRSAVIDEVLELSEGLLYLSGEVTVGNLDARLMALGDGHPLPEPNSPLLSGVALTVLGGLVRMHRWSWRSASVPPGNC